MIVYGDPQSVRRTSELVASITSSVASVGDGRDLDLLRSLLIRAGELEQAVSDEISGHLDPRDATDAERRVQSLTNALARAFCDALEGNSPNAAALEYARFLLTELRELPEAPVTVKVPEGFQFYLLYPEQYARAARQWDAAQGNEERQPVLVVGVRTIGTALSAVVAATLQDCGWPAMRMTVRPTGHPFERRVEIEAERVARVTRVLVVDEGPGLSGSSMAAVAEALAAAGMEPPHISFLPGHDGDPGSAASDTVREWWSRVPRFVVDRDTLRWGGHSLQEALAAATVELEPGGGRVVEVQDLGGGLWRGKVLARPEDWPPAAVPFEAPKYRCVRSDGSSVLWKFAGLASGREGTALDGVVQRLSRLAERGWTANPLGSRMGFVAQPWIEAVTLSRAELDGEHLRRMARYVAAAAGPPLTRAEHAAALERLGELLYWNVREGLDPEAAERARLLRDRALALTGADLPASYGDGRMAPHEWLRTSDGHVLKADTAGHSGDHTVIGAQSVVWDIAGTIVEWDLDGEQTARFEGELAEAGLPKAPAELLDFYRAAYVAFRLGLFTMCLSSAAGDPEEQQRLETEIARFGRWLVRLTSAAG